MADSPLASDLNRSGVEFLLVDLDTALTFLDLADVTRIEETMKRNRENARQAYATVVRLLPTVKPDAHQQRAIDEKLSRLRARLESAGYEF